MTNLDAPAAPTITDYLLELRGGKLDVTDRSPPQLLTSFARSPTTPSTGDTDHALGTTGLVHEAWFKLVEPDPRWSRRDQGSLLRCRGAGNAAGVWSTTRGARR